MLLVKSSWSCIPTSGAKPLSLVVSETAPAARPFVFLEINDGVSENVVLASIANNEPKNVRLLNVELVTHTI